MRTIAHLLRQLAPFLMGAVLGALFVYTIDSWGVGLRQIVIWSAVTTAAVLIVALILWLTYRYMLARIGPATTAAMVDLARDLGQTPSNLADAQYRQERIWPLIPTAVRALVAWFSFTSALALAITLAANLTLLATLSVQYLQADRLSAQNELLRVQMVADRVSAGRQLRDDIRNVAETQAVIERIVKRYAEISAPLFVKGLLDTCTGTRDPEQCRETSLIAMLEDVFMGKAPEYLLEAGGVLDVLIQRAAEFENLSDLLPTTPREFVARATTTCRLAPGDAAILNGSLARLARVDRAVAGLMNEGLEPSPQRVAELTQQLQVALDPVVSTVERKSGVSPYALGPITTEIARQSKETLRLLSKLNAACNSEQQRLEQLRTELERELPSNGNGRPTSR